MMRIHGLQRIRSGLAGVLAPLVVAAPLALLTPAPVHGAEETGFAKVQLMLKKLRESMASLKDLDELEKAGMSKKDVDRMRRALKAKIEELIDETIASIQEL